MNGIGEVVIPATEVYGFTIVVPMEMAHFFEKGRNVREVKESMSMNINSFNQESYFERLKKALSCAFTCNGYFNGMYEDGNQLRVKLNFPTYEGVWNFVVQFVSVA